MSERVLGGRYRLEARIGSGGMAEVYRGFDTTLNRTVAIKVLLPQFARDAGFVERFRREAQAAARMNQPNIVGVYDSGSDDETQFIVMEFIEGRTLADFMSQGGSLSPMQAVEVAEKICDALAYAHARGVIHRDIKPANIMVTRDGEVKVMDFGIARIVAGPETAPQTSAVLGTAAYISPEQAQGQGVDGRTDIYSLGAVLYEMLAKRPPFVGDSPVSVAYKQVNETPEPPSAHNPDVPPRLDAVVMRALAKNPANRYQGASEFEDDLKRVRAGQEVEATPLLPVGGEATQVISRQQTAVLPPTGDAPGGGRKVWLGVLIGILIVAILGGGGYLLATTLLSDEDGTTPVVVPNVVGLLLDKATERLQDAGLIVGDVTKRASATARVDEVLSQSPVNGETLNEGDPVDLVIAKEVPTVLVPDVTELTLADAQAALRAVKLELGTTTQAPSDTIPVGQIISQSPEAQTEVPEGTEVNVVVSSGTDKVVLPDVTCLSFGAAKAQLQALGLNVLDGGTVTPNPACPNPNRVASTSPGAGTELDPGASVTLFRNETPGGGTGPTGPSGPTGTT
ncbi:MAG TPA: Stk1 family PASTA domain-containing Ser/Thr kinase [Actinomycetota bacterium]